MQKKLLSLAIASALAIPGAAMADVKSKSGGNIEIYGKIHASYDFVDNDNNTGVDDSDDSTGVFRQSRLGFKGKEDLGNGLKGIWQVETFIDTTADNDATTGDNPNTGDLGLRNTFVGLQGDQWGTIAFGLIDTPYKTATEKLDIFADTIADYNNIIGSLDGNMVFNNRANRVAAYTTPDFNGFKASVARISSQEREAANREESEAWSVMAMYDQGPFFASAAYENLSGDDDRFVETVGSEQIDAWKIGLGYTFGNSKVAFIYEDIEHDDATLLSGESRDAYWAALSHKFGANEVKLAYGKADDSDAANADDGADNWSIGIDHNFSKRTKIYAIYTDMDNDTAGSYGLFDGRQHRSANNAYSAPNADADMKAFSVGIVHKF